MLLKSLELQGFKTFPDKTKLNFGNGITAVVGPNGSGKSNISDAVRWVLGEQSSKILRCSKMEDVIFNGTSSRNAQGFAQVTLVIDNKDRELPFDNDFVTVERRYYRSGESEYLINKTLVRLKDVNELFMDTGLGRDGYSIISQGKIDEIISSKNEERREIFEEAAGISKYRYRKEEARRRLERTEDNLVRLRDIFKELKERIVPLENDANKAKKYIKYNEDKKSIEIGIWLHSLSKFDEDVLEHENKLEIAKEQYNSEKKVIDETRKQIDELFNKSNLYSSKVDELLRGINTIKNAENDNRKQIALLENDIEHNNKNVERLEKEIIGSNEQLEKCNKEITENNEKINSYKEYINKIKVNEEDLKNNLQKVENRLEKFLNNNKKISDEISKLSSELTNVKIEYAKCEASINENKLQSEILYDKISNEKIEIIKNENSYNNNIKIKNDITNKINSLNEEAHKIKIQINSNNIEHEKLKKEIDDLNLNIKQYYGRAKMLEDLEHNMEGFQKSVKLIVKEASMGKIKGVHGPVIRLIKVESKYLTAIETSLGASQQNIVVDTQKNAKDAINYLKLNNGGRATFLPIDVIKGNALDETELNKNKGFLGIANKLCTFDSKYNNIINYLLGRILIVDNLDNATKIASKYNYKFRVVTIDGQVVNAGGSLTGGAFIKNSGILGRVNEIEEIKRKALEDQKEVKIKNEELILLNETISKLNDKYTKITEEIAKNQEEMIKINEQCRIGNEKTTKGKEIIINLDDEINNTNNKLKELQENELNLKQEINNLNLKIEKYGDNIGTIKNDSEQLTNKRELINSELQKINLDIITTNKDIEAIENNNLEIENRKLNLKNEIINLKNEIDDNKQKEAILKIKVSNIKTNITDVTNEIINKKQEIEKLSGERTKIEQDLTDLRKQEQEKTTQSEIIGRELTRLEEKSNNLKDNYNNIENRLWDEYELTKREAQQVAEKITNLKESQKQLDIIKGKIRKLGIVNLGAVEEYKEVSERYEFMKEQITDIQTSKKELMKLIDDLNKQMKEVFFEKFEIINKNFNEAFKELFAGGTARLFLNDEENILTSGIEIEVKPPGKIVSRLESLSGGEKALVAICIYFAIMKVSPSPFCVLDEIEAALDDVNIEHFSSYLKRMNKNTQFIIITHRRGTMENSDVLYGVTMQEKGVSKLLELQITNISDKLNIAN